MTVFFYGCITLDGYLAIKERRMSGDGDDGIFSMSGDGDDGIFRMARRSVPRTTPFLESIAFSRLLISTYI